MSETSIWLTLLAAGLATYFWRALGVVVAGRIDPNGPVFEWVGCVAYALLAGLTARMILLPIGALQATDLGCRLLALAVGIAALRLSRGNIALGVLAGVLALMALTAAGLRLWG
ncbi:MAG: AzlD domain-containing protein [Rhodospirillaceae bacterium]